MTSNVQKIRLILLTVFFKKVAIISKACRDKSSQDLYNCKAGHEHCCSKLYDYFFMFQMFLQIFTVNGGNRGTIVKFACEL